MDASRLQAAHLILLKKSIPFGALSHMRDFR
jgi:hypothetical protein